MVRALWRQFVWLVAAAVAGGGALYFIYAEKWSLLFAARLREESPYLQPLVLGIGMIVIMRLRDRLFPGTEGTGIPQAIVALKLGEGPARGSVLSLRILIGKVILLTLALFIGATVGREGPSVHVAACALYLANRVATFAPSEVERGLIRAGGAAGIGAAFNAPFAGLMFAIEEIGRSFEKENASLMIRTVIVACLVCVAVLGNYLFYGHVEASLPNWRAWLWLPVIGVAGGLLGGGFARAVVEATPRVARLNRRRPYVVAGSLGLGMAVLGVITSGVSYGSGDAQTMALLRGELLPWTYPIAKAAANFLALISAIPGGLFTPSLSVGAGLGDQLAFYITDVPRQSIVLLAMGAYFCGVVQSPMTVAIIIVEMTDTRAMLMPLLITTVAAYHASRLLCPESIYEALADRYATRLRSTSGKAHDLVQQ
jgi:H+/Cl- antiporter ClcA